MSRSKSTSLIKLDNLSKPANTLIKVISNSVGLLYKPVQIRNVAQAKADAEIISAKSKIEIADLYRRTEARWNEEEAQKQKNMETIILKSTHHLIENAKPEQMDRDWIVNFFDKSRIVSDGDMQDLWSRLLSGEANTPGAYSTRTINMISDFNKNDTELFTKFCGFCWEINQEIIPLIFDEDFETYNMNGINRQSIMHLENIGLIRYNEASFYKKINDKNNPIPNYHGKGFIAKYYDKSLILIPKGKVELDIGKVLLTQCGREIASICGSVPVDGYFEYMREKWKNICIN